MAIPVINLNALDGDKRIKTMSLLHEACANWGFFWVEDHGIDKDLMAKVSHLVNLHYETNMKESFYKSEMARRLEEQNHPLVGDWESSFFIHHQPSCDINDIPGLSEELRNTAQIYVEQLVKIAETLAELMSENLGLEKDYLRRAFSDVPFVGTKVAKYPKCPRPEMVTGLRAHTDAGGIILLLQDDTVRGLEFFKDGEWVDITPSKDNKIFVNLGDQVEVLSNGVYKSILHRVNATKDGSRLSIATFYNPGGDAIISPAPNLMYPTNYRFQDYLDLYFQTKFSDKGARFQSMKTMT